MRVNVNNRLMPGVQSERTYREGNEVARDAIYQHGAYLGDVVYVRRKVAAGTSYGWRPAKAHHASVVTTKLDAIRRLPRWDAES